MTALLLVIEMLGTPEQDAELGENVGDGGTAIDPADAEVATVSRSVLDVVVDRVNAVDAVKVGLDVLDESESVAADSVRVVSLVFSSFFLVCSSELLVDVGAGLGVSFGVDVEIAVNDETADSTLEVSDSVELDTVLDFRDEVS